MTETGSSENAVDTPIAGVTVFTDGDIKVRPREATPDPASFDDLGELTWTLVLPPGESSVIRHRFTVEHPAQVTVIGL